MFHAPAFLHGHSHQIFVFVLSAGLAAFATAWDFSSVYGHSDTMRTEAAFFVPGSFGLPTMSQGPRSSLGDAASRQQVRIVGASTQTAKHRLAAAQHTVDVEEQAIAADEFDLAAKTVEAQRLQGLWSQGAVTTEVRDVAMGALERLMIALGRDRELKYVAEHEVVLAAADVESARANTERPMVP